METTKERLLKIIDEIPEQEVDKVLDFAEYLKTKIDRNISKDLMKASDLPNFWDNDSDDGVWNDV